MEFAWNTGCWYSKEGQRIAARLVDDQVYFVDIDRGISGWFDPVLEIRDKNDLRSEVMATYLAGGYKTFGMDMAQVDELVNLAKAL